MAYNPTIWINDDGTGTVGTPVIADHMNNIEQGIEANDTAIAEHETKIQDNTQQINDLLPKRIGISTLNGWQQAVTVNLSLNGNIVTVTGIINGGTATNGTVITTITDTRFKPSTLQKAFCDQYGGASGNARKRLSVSSNGNITLDEAFDSASFYMLNFSYPVGV